MLQFQLKRLVFLNGHRLAHDFAPGKFTDDALTRRELQDLRPFGIFLFTLPRQAGNKPFLRLDNPVKCNWAWFCRR